MKDIWVAREATIAGYPAIQLGRAGSLTLELCLAGYYGEVWVDGGGFKAWLSSTAVARMNRYHGLNLELPKQGEETIYRVKDRSELEGVLLAIKYTRRRPTQVKLANNR